MKIYLIAILFFVFVKLVAQKNYTELGLLPSVTMSYKPNENWQATTKLETSHATSKNHFSELSGLKNYSDEVDWQMYLVRRLNPFWKISVGYQHGFVEGGKNDHQAIQQLSNTIRGSGFRLGNRFRADQIFNPNSSAEFRLRYRLSFETPLNGQTLDEGEMYFLASNEPMIRFSDEINRLENRLYVSSGWYLSSKQKIEFGLEYRLINKTITDYWENVFLIRVGWLMNY